ncbi:AI-2E family transporter [Candidatus Uhrbacteria bacterium]|nr:AI-2E family transporter [Candidatus Uhrbacteria bacterium]
MATFKQEQSLTVNISTLTFLKILLIIGILAFIYFIRDILAILFIALLLSSALSPWVQTMESRKIPRAAGIFLIYFSILAIVALAIVLLIPPLVEQFNELSLSFPSYSDHFVQVLQSYNPDINIVDQMKRLFVSIQSSLLDIASGIFLKIFDILRGIVAFFLVFVVTFYMVVEENMMRRALKTLTPSAYHPFAERLLGKIQKKIGLWLRGQAILSFLIFLLSFIGLSILGVHYALVLALVAGLTEFMPLIGPIIGAIPAIFIAFNQDPLLALWVLLLYVLIQRLENDLLVPRVMQQAVGLNPLVSIIALLIGAKFGGIIGILLAIPVATVCAVFASEFFGNSFEHQEEEI